MLHPTLSSMGKWLRCARGKETAMEYPLKARSLTSTMNLIFTTLGQKWKHHLHCSGAEGIGTERVGVCPQNQRVASWTHTSQCVFSEWCQEGLKESACKMKGGMGVIYSAVVCFPPKCIIYWLNWYSSNLGESKHIRILKPTGITPLANSNYQVFQRSNPGTSLLSHKCYCERVQ